MNLRNYLLLFVFAITSVSFFSCEKNNTDNDNTDDCPCSRATPIYMRECAGCPDVIVYPTSLSDIADNENVGISDVIPYYPSPVAYYDTDCNKLPAEPETGIYCIELSDGQLKKYMK